MVEIVASTQAMIHRLAGGFLPDDWLIRSCILDMTSWVEFLSRPHCGDAVIQSAREMLLSRIQIQSAF